MLYHSTHTLPSVRLSYQGALRDLETCLSPRMSTRALLPPCSLQILTFVLALILNLPRSPGFSTTGCSLQPVNMRAYFRPQFTQIRFQISWETSEKLRKSVTKRGAVFLTQYDVLFGAGTIKRMICNPRRVC